jgi:hypothetical protein
MYALSYSSHTAPPYNKDDKVLKQRKVTSFAAHAPLPRRQTSPGRQPRPPPPRAAPDSKVRNRKSLPGATPIAVPKQRV